MTPDSTDTPRRAADTVPAMVGCAIGRPALITCDNWFYAPDGRSYRAVWGTIRAVHDSEKVLGIRTNSKSTNWYVEIGCMIIAGCQIHYVLACDQCSFDSAKDWSASAEHGLKEYDRPCGIFNADAPNTSDEGRKPAQKG